MSCTVRAMHGVRGQNDACESVDRFRRCPREKTNQAAREEKAALSSIKRPPPSCDLSYSPNPLNSFAHVFIYLTSTHLTQADPEERPT